MKAELQKFVEVLGNEKFKDDENLKIFKNAIDRGYIVDLETLFKIMLETIQTLDNVITNMDNITIKIDDFEKGVDLSHKINDYIPIAEVRNKLGHVAGLLDTISFIDTDKDIPFENGEDYSPMLWTSYNESVKVLEFFRQYEVLQVNQIDEDDE